MVSYLHQVNVGAGGRTITGENKELLLAIQLVVHNLGVRSNDLLFRLQSEVLLELEVTNSARQCEVAWLSGWVTKGDWNLPLTRPNSTKPPAAVMRAVSSLLVGLWSLDMALASPLYPRTERESPAFATIMRPSGVTSPTTAVQPEGSLKNVGSARRSSSVFKKTCFNAAS